MQSGKAFADEMVARVQQFCDEHRGHLPAYSYVPCSTDAQRLKVMQSRFFNEIRSAEVIGARSSTIRMWGKNLKCGLND